MADYAPPSGPPPPKVPEGWKAVWNAQYSEWFFVNIYTKKSQWDKPTEPVYPPGEGGHAAPDGPPPSYVPGGAGAPHATGDSKAGLSTNNPYSHGALPEKGGSAANLTEDERLARKLQQEEHERAGSRGPGSGAGGGAAADFYGSGGTPQPNAYASGYGSAQQGGYPQQQQQQQGYQDQYAAQDKGKGKGGLLGKLLGKASGGSSSHGQPQYGHQQPMGYGGGYPQQQQGYGYPQQGYYPQQQAYAARPGRKPGLGAGGAAALGVGGGLLGGALLGEALGDAGDGGGDYGDGGGDFGGDGGGDFGGDGGGDFGGGDF